MTMEYYDKVIEAADAVRQRIRQPPTIGVVLGSGLGEFADTLDAAVSMPFDTLPHWPAAGIDGHGGRLVVGQVRDRVVAVAAGRAHAYEGHDLRTVTFAVRVLGVLGVQILILTNAAGGINTGLRPGALMLIADHINLTGDNPLVGGNDARLGPRFPDMTEIYSARLRALAAEVGRERDINLTDGVYVGLRGPSYETPAEIRYLRMIGGDAVGMSTVPEAIVARHMSMEVLGISCITNMASGVSPQRLDHAEVLAATRRVRAQVTILLENIIGRL